MFKLPILLLFVAIQLALSTPISDDLIIQLRDGQVRGATYMTNTNKMYFGFQGIPFASPPIGNLRFEAPQPPRPWSGIRDATRDNNVCLTPAHEANENEDCLYINVYTPELKPATKLPVMFWIYGGAWTGGNSLKAQYGPDFLVEKDVIMVSFNYRLGPFGFLSTGDSAIRGNTGLKDQNMALKWTHDNIAAFGGDPDQITIFGQSAGGASTGLHLMSTKSAGLFRAAIVESGSALNYWTIDQNPMNYAESLVATLNGGHYENDTQRIKEYLLQKSAGEIIAASAALALPGPVMEVEDANAFITSAPYQLLASGRFNKVPIVIGICAEESLTFLGGPEGARQMAASIDANPTQYIPSDFKPNQGDVFAVIKGIHDIYLNYDGEPFSNNLAALATMYTDNAFARPLIKHAQLASNFVNVYLYQFAYYGRPLVDPYINGAEKAGHSAELPFIFRYWGMSDNNDPADMLTQNRMTTLWTNFAKFLNPTPAPSELLNNIIWPTINAFNPSNVPYLNINNTVELRTNLKGQAYLAWDNLYERYAQKPFITY